MADSGSTAGPFVAELTRLVQRVRPWSLDRWAARATGRDGSRAEAAYALVLLLAERTPSTPAGAVPSRLRDLALTDQLAVVGAEAARWITENEPSQQGSALADELLAAVLATRASLEVAPLG